MAQDVFIPGDELQQAQQMLNQIHDQIDLGRNNFDFDAAFGHEFARHAPQNFEKKWNDGKKQLKKQIKGIGDAIGNILDSMNKTDQDSSNKLGN